MALAEAVRAAVPRGLVVYRLSLTFGGPTLEGAQAALARAATSAAELGPGRGLLGAVDVRKGGEGWHLYALALVVGVSEARRIQSVALAGLDYLGRSQKVTSLGYGRGATQGDYELCVDYMLKPWATGTRDLDLDVVASGSLAPAWAAYRATLATHDSVPSCKHCGRALTAGATRLTRRREYCGQSCRQKADRRRSRVATAAELGEALDIARDLDGDDAPLDVLRRAVLRDLKKRGLRPARGALLMLVGGPR